MNPTPASLEMQRLACLAVASEVGTPLYGTPRPAAAQKDAVKPAYSTEYLINEHVTRDTRVVRRPGGIRPAFGPAITLLIFAASCAHGEVKLHWLEAPALAPAATTWGVPWPAGAVKKGQSFSLRDEKGTAVPVQTWPLAYWPDGSLKWTAHAAVAPASNLTLEQGTAAMPVKPVAVTETAGTIMVDTGVIQCRIPRQGKTIIESMTRDGRVTARDGRLVALLDGGFTGVVSKVTVEQTGPVRAVVKLEGKHEGGARTWLPFTVRLYFYAGSDQIRMMHTFIFDGDEKKDFIHGLGVVFDVPMTDALYDRHVRFAGEGHGLWAEAVKGLTGLRRDPGLAVREAQVAGQAVPAISERVRSRLDWIPAWGDYTLTQLCADGFQIRKRTAEGCAWIAAGAGQHAGGLAYVGGVSGGLVLGLRDFWQRHPTQIDIRGVAGACARATLWMWSPEAQPMDLRPYHDGLGMDSHAKELEGLDITYEDYEKGYGTPVGIARTSEIMLWAVPTTPTREETVRMADTLQTLPQLTCEPAHYLQSRVFGGLFSLPDRSTALKKQIEDQQDYLLKQYIDEVSQRRWYGFWDYGDVRHTYDPDRHEWCYDVGGFAWDNSELSPDLWLWYSFLRSGRADVFRLAEAMTRHVSEVDTYHLGRFRMLGTRHGVQHWSDSAKQVRISNAAYRRFYYYLTADERVGDILRELVDADKTFLTVDPRRKIHQMSSLDPHALPVESGTDWGALAAAWLTEWERTGDNRWRQKLLNIMNSIGSLPHGFLTANALYDIEAESFHAPANAGVEAHHLKAVFGLVEINAELIQLFPEATAFRDAWLGYCELYNADPAEQKRRLGCDLGGLNLRESHSRLTAYVAWQRHDPALAARAWSEFIGGKAGLGLIPQLQTRRLEGPSVLTPVDEGPGLNTNSSSQWGLAAIQLLALIGDYAPESGKEHP